MRRRFLAGVFAFVLGLAGLRAEQPAAPAVSPAVPSAVLPAVLPTVAPAVSVNWPVFLARQDLVWPQYPNRWGNAPFIGNGNLGAYIRRGAGNALAWEVNRTDVSHEGLRYGMGHVALRVAGGFEGSGDTRLDLWNAEVRGTIKTARGLMRWRSFVAASPSVMVLELTGLRVEPGAQVVWLPTLARPPLLGKRTEGFPPDALHPPPQVHSVVDGVDSTQTFNHGGAYAVVLRRIYSSLDRKVYVVAVDRGNSAKRALSEAQLSAERAASLGFDALVASHRGWWHQFYPASFVTLPDPRLEAFYWIQMYKLGSALRPGGPLLDVTGPWYRPYAPNSAASPGLTSEAALAYGPIFGANRISLGDSLFSTDLRANQPPRDLSQVSQLVWQDYRFSMDEGVLANRVIPLLLRAIEAPKAEPAFVRWALQTLIRVGDRRKEPDPRVKQWKERLAALPPSAGAPRTLQFLRPDRPGEHKLIEAAIQSREGEPSGTFGRGLGEAASYRALLGQGSPALDDLNLLLDRYLKPNTFYADSNPLIGAPLAAATALQDLLLQSWGNRLRVFPAMPPQWKEASFSTLRGDGGFLVSGVWHDGAAAWIRVEATSNLPCRIAVPGWTQAVVRAARRPGVTVTPGTVSGEFMVALGGKGGWAVLAPSADAPLPPIAPLAGPDQPASHPFPALPVP